MTNKPEYPGRCPDCSRIYPRNHKPGCILYLITPHEPGAVLEVAVSEEDLEEMQ